MGRQDPAAAVNLSPPSSPPSTVDHDIEPSEHLYSPPSPQSTMGFDAVSHELGQEDSSASVSARVCVCAANEQLPLPVFAASRRVMKSLFSLCLLLSPRSPSDPEVRLSRSKEKLCHLGTHSQNGGFKAN